MKSTSAGTHRDEKSILVISSWAIFKIFSENDKKCIKNNFGGAREQTCQHNSCNEIIDLFISRTQFIFDSFENRTIDKNRPSFDRRLKWVLKCHNWYFATFFANSEFPSFYISWQEILGKVIFFCKIFEKFSTRPKTILFRFIIFDFQSVKFKFEFEIVIACIFLLLTQYQNAFVQEHVP